MFDSLFSHVPNIAVADVKKAIDAKEKVILLDVRTPDEYARDHISGSINIPFDEVELKVKKIIPDKKKKVYVYCLSGSRSVRAVAEMINLGYTQVYDIKQGLLAWRASGYPY